MRWDDRKLIPSATVDADPIATPAAVPIDRTFRMNDREPQSDALSRSLLVGLHAPAVEHLTFELYAMDEEDEEAAWAARRWSLVASGAVQGGQVAQAVPVPGAAGFVAGGEFYLRVTVNGLTATRTLVLRATN